MTRVGRCHCAGVCTFHLFYPTNFQVGKRGERKKSLKNNRKILVGSRNTDVFGSEYNSEVICLGLNDPSLRNFFKFIVISNLFLNYLLFFVFSSFCGCVFLKIKIAENYMVFLFFSCYFVYFIFHLNRKKREKKIRNGNLSPKRNDSMIFDFLLPFCDWN